MKNLFLLSTNKPSELYFNTETNALSRSYDLSRPKSQHIYITSDEEIKKGGWFFDTQFSSLGAQKARWDTKDKHQSKILLTTDQDLIKDGIQEIDGEFLDWMILNPTCEEVTIEKIYDKLYIPEEKLAQYQSKPKEMQFEYSSDIDECYRYKIVIPKEKSKYPIGGYAPGNYSCRCVNCKQEFTGDKRAVQCEPCATGVVETKKEFKHVPYRGKVWEPKQETLEEAAVSYAVKVNTKMGGNKEAYQNCSRLDFIEGANWQQERSYSEKDMREFAVFYFTHQSKSAEHWGKDLFKVWEETVKKK